MRLLLQNCSRLVVGGSVDAFDEGVGLAEEAVDLGLDGAGVGFAFFEAGPEFVFGHAEADVLGEALDEIVAFAFSAAVGLGGGDGVFFDDFVGGLASDAAFDGGHHDGGAEEEGEVVLIFSLDDGGVGIHLIEDGDHGLEQSVDCEEGVGEHDAADDGAGDVAFVPLVSGEGGGHGEVAAEDGFESVDALAGAAVHFVRHGGGADLAFGEAFGGEFVPGHEAESLGEAGGGGGDAVERGDNLEVEAAGVDLADVGEDAGDAEVGGDAVFEVDDFVGVAFEEAELVELGADGAFEPADGVGVEELLELVGGEEHFFAEHGEAFAEGGDLGGDVVGTGGDDEVAVLVGTFCEAVEDGGGFHPDDLEGAVDLELLDILGEVAAGHAFVNVFVAGEFAKLFDASFHIVAGDALTFVDGGEIDFGDDSFIIGDGFFRNGEAKISLGFHDGDPEFAFEADFSFGRPDVAHGGGGVAFGEDVGDHFGKGSRG